MKAVPTDVRKADAAAKGSAVDKLVLATVNAPYTRVISAAVLADCIAHVKLDDWPVHVATFFTEVAPELVFAFAGCHGVSTSKLAEAYRAMKAMTGEHSPGLEAALVSMATSP